MKKVGLVVWFKFYIILFFLRIFWYWMENLGVGYFYFKWSLDLKFYISDNKWIFFINMFFVLRFIR